MSTPLPATTPDRLSRLKALLQGMEAKDFERLAAALFSEVTGLAIAVAASGFQHGGDAGPAGRQGRRFRIETKRYADNTSLSHRELLGEVDHALARDEALEGWFLVATREVPEQLEQDLEKKSKTTGVPIIVVDWKDSFPSLAALCTVSVDVVRKFANDEAAALVVLLKRDGQAALERLRRDLATWQLGFEALRSASHNLLQQLWGDPRVARGTFGQDTAGSCYRTTIARPVVSTALDHWWHSAANSGSPALVLGQEGAGKTWATMAWLAGKRAELPIVMPIPASAVAKTDEVSSTSLKRFLADRLHELVGTQDEEHWRRRLEHLLHRPLSEGAVLTLFLDGMNQQPTAPWLDILRVLQLPMFAGRIRVIASTREFHLTRKLGSLQGLIDKPAFVRVELYDDTPGGELDQRLALDELSRRDLHPELIPLARVPRLFALVVKFNDRLVDAGQVTVHRLLWEYGKDTLGVRGGQSFSPDEWRAWLHRVALQHREGIRRYTLKSLAEDASRADLSEADVFRRLSDLIDAPFMTGSGSGEFELKPTLVHHALGAALLTTLEEHCAQGKVNVSNALLSFLDPIAGLDERAEILRAAVSISVERELVAATEVVTTLVSAWLQTQNIPEGHQDDLFRIAGYLVGPLLTVVDEAGEGGHRATQLLAVNALRAVDKNDEAALSQIIQFAANWLRHVPRGTNSLANQDESAEKARSAAYINRVGVDQNGPHTVLGVPLTLVDRWSKHATSFIPAILEGFTLHKAAPIFEALALHHAVRGHGEQWDAMKWLVLFNPRDYEKTVKMLRSLSEAVKVRTEESGVHPQLKFRAAALLLWLIGTDTDDVEASRITPKGFYKGISYAEDYLKDPANSLFELEYRHADSVLAQADIPIGRRIDRASRFLTDPTFTPPTRFAIDINQNLASINPSQLDRERSNPLDYKFKSIEIALARCEQHALAKLHRAKIASYASRPPEARTTTARNANQLLLLADSDARDAAKALRLGAAAPDEAEETFVRNQLLLLEILDLSAVEQITVAIEAAPRYYYYSELRPVLKQLRVDEMDCLVAQYADDPTASLALLHLIVARPVSLGGAAWQWALGHAFSTEEKAIGPAFKLLYRVEAKRFGKVLLDKNWSWTESGDDWVQEYGSLALIEASLALPFEPLLPRIAPWLVLKAARLRGSNPSDVELAALVVDQLMLRSGMAPEPPGSTLIISDEAREQDPHSYAIVIEPEGEDIAGKLRAMGDPQTYAATRQRILDKVALQIAEGRKSGASLYLRTLTAEDFKPVLQHAGRLIFRWLEGAEQRTMDFKRRVFFAEGAYIALCQALLLEGDSRGLLIWRALRDVLTTTFKSVGNVDKMLHVLMSVPTSPEIEAALDEVMSLETVNTDQDLLDVAIAAAINDRSAWLSGFAKRDQQSGVPWRQLRGQQLLALSARHDLPCASGWDHGEMDAASRRQCSFERLQHREACARHWWNEYWTAESDSAAYAAWVLFMQTADRRAHVWMHELMPTDATEKLPKRYAHWALQVDELKRATDTVDKKLRETFLGRKIERQVYPWLTAD